MSAASTPADVARVVLERGRDATGAAAGSVALIDKDGTTITTLMLVGYSDAVGREFPSYAITTAELPTPHSIRQGPVWLRDGDAVRSTYPHLRRFHESMSHEAVAASRSSWRASRSAAWRCRSPTGAPSTRRSGRS